MALRLERVAGQTGAMSVSQFVACARDMVESSLPLAWLTGEITGFTRSGAGHCYFSLKDASAQVGCVMFRQRTQGLDWSPANGDQVELRGKPTLYEPRGTFQVVVEGMRQAGHGALYEAFERLKRKLEAEGLFAPARKRPLPPFPVAVGVVTSPQAAALRDVLITLRRRWPAARVVLYPTLVQGEGAAAGIASAIAVASARAEVEVLLVCRGGGSMEDLQAFNDESVARAIAACAVPVVSGVGHETDFTIADFVADLRAATPTAAAVAVVPDGEVLAQSLDDVAEALSRHVTRALEQRMQRLDTLAARLRHPGERLALQARALVPLAMRLGRAWQSTLERREWALGALAGRQLAAAPRPERRLQALEPLRLRLQQALLSRLSEGGNRVETAGQSLRHLDPGAVLERGYAIVRGPGGTILTEASAVAPGQIVRVRVARGSLEAAVQRVSTERE